MKKADTALLRGIRHLRTSPEPIGSAHPHGPAVLSGFMEILTIKPTPNFESWPPRQGSVGLGPSIVFDVAFARPSTVKHARDEVYLHVAGEDCNAIMLVRPNGDICGRKDAWRVGRDSIVPHPAVFTFGVRQSIAPISSID